MKVLEGERIRLRPVEDTDLQYLIDLRENKEICKTINYEPLTMMQQINWFNSMGTSTYFCVCLTSGEIVGLIGLFDIHETHRRAKWTLRIHPDHWRKGYARESIKLFLKYVFEVRNINKLMGDCFEDNIAECNNLSKLHFIPEGIWHEHYYHEGKYKNAVQYVMLKKDYENIKHLY